MKPDDLANLFYILHVSIVIDTIGNKKKLSTVHKTQLLKAHWQISKKNGVSKSIVYMIKYGNFQPYRVHTDGVI